ncbi:hypothetical protein [Streptomyces sp. NPDC054958]
MSTYCPVESHLSVSEPSTCWNAASPTPEAAPQTAQVPDMTGKSGDLLVESLKTAGFANGYRATSFHQRPGTHGIAPDELEDL